MCVRSNNRDETLRGRGVLSGCGIPFPKRALAGREESLGLRSPHGSGASSPLTDFDEKTSESIDTPWNVVVYNDPVNLMSYVTKVFIKVLGFSLEKAEQHMMEVHKLGRSIVWTGAQEKAEFYVQELHSNLLLATLEKSV